MSTKSERDHMGAVKAMPCIACELEGVRQTDVTEVHHIVDKGYRRLSGGHFSVLPLCKYHHRGVYPSGMTADEMLFDRGPSLALHKRKFIATYGTERELLAKVNKRLEAA